MKMSCTKLDGKQIPSMQSSRVKLKYFGWIVERASESFTENQIEHILLVSRREYTGRTSWTEGKSVPTCCKNQSILLQVLYILRKNGG